MPVYVILAGDTEMVKIGWAARDVEARRKTLQAGHWETLTVIRVIDGGRLAEVAMHRRFADLRVRSEWFRFHPDMLTFIPVARPRDAEKSGPAPQALHAQLLRQLGGKAKVARHLSLSDRVITKWHERGIPAIYWQEVIDFGATLNPPVIVTHAALKRTKPTGVQVAA